MKRKRRVIGEFILALIFAFLIGITIWSFGLKEGLIIWAIGLGVSVIILIAMFFITEDE